MINKTRGDRFLEFGSCAWILEGFDVVFLIVPFLYVYDIFEQGKCSCSCSWLHQAVENAIVPGIAHVMRRSFWSQARTMT